MPGNQASHPCLPGIPPRETLHSTDRSSCPGVARSPEGGQRKTHEVEESGSASVSVHGEISARKAQLFA